MKPKTTKALEDPQAEIRAKADAARAKATPKKPIGPRHEMTMKKDDWLTNNLTPKAGRGKSLE